MPLTDALQVSITLGAAAVPRSTFGTSLLLHKLTDAQDTLFGADFLKLLTLATWQSTLENLGITSSEPAYLDVEAHFTQKFTPNEAYIGRQGIEAEQVVITIPNSIQTWDIDVPGSPADGAYDVIVPGEASTPFSFTAATSSQQDVVDGIIAQFVAGTVASFTWVDAGAGKIQLTAITPGFDLVVSESSPASSMTVTETQTLSVADGLYEIGIPAEASDPFGFTASTSIGTVVKDALLAALVAGNLQTATFVDSTVGDVLSITITQIDFESTMATTVTSPGSSMTQVVGATTVVNRAQVTDVEIVVGTVPPNADDGLYTLTVTTSTGQKQYTHTGATETPTAVAAALKAAYDLDASDLATMTVVAGVMALTATTAGISYTATIESPGDDATSTVRIPNRDSGEDVLRAFNLQKGWYMLVPGSHVKHELISMARAIEALSLGRQAMLQSSDADIRTTATTDVLTELTALAYERSQLVEHPIDAEGVHAGWVGYYLTKPVGTVNPKGRQLAGLTGQVFSNPDESTNIATKNGSYLEVVSTIGNMMLGTGFSVVGRPIEVFRILDQFTSDLNVSLLEGLVVPDFVPYSTDGIAIGTSIIRNEFNRAVEQGYAVPGTLELTIPTIAQATNIQRQEGELPPWNFRLQIRVAAHTFVVNGVLYQ